MKISKTLKKKILITILLGNAILVSGNQPCMQYLPNNQTIESYNISLSKHQNPDFNVQVNTEISPSTVKFTIASFDTDSCRWYFGDGNSSTILNPIHTYSVPGVYSVELHTYKNNNKYQAIRDVDITKTTMASSEAIIFPNAFVPSKVGSTGGYYEAIDYKNEVFHPVAKGVIEYRLMVFNRWGEMIFESNDILIGWDGYYKDKLCSQDVYVWRAVGRFSNNQAFDIRGNVTLIR